MIQFRLTVSIRIVDAVINDPELSNLWINIYTSHNPYAFDDAMCIPAILPPDQFHLAGKILVNHRVVKDQKSVGCLDNL